MANAESLSIVHKQGSQRWGLGDRGLSGGDIVELCCSGGWIKGRFEWHGTVEAPPKFHFSIELGGGLVHEQSIDVPEGALMRLADGSV